MVGCSEPHLGHRGGGVSGPANRAHSDGWARLMYERGASLFLFSASLLPSLPLGLGGKKVYMESVESGLGEALRHCCKNEKPHVGEKIWNVFKREGTCH